ncbi:hypothetical protein D9619_011455 [Psilocybe cf. subviscida]|uniref:DUF5648 domain-containing protein n=1 Tax=Psilocybe cf. subviscida TaxID=2480587 RepID=A0A8H5F9N6_9AGAR|nr:hypothetical protein D9619_011455 [Psilocybe cf. subviscida]
MRGQFVALSALALTFSSGVLASPLQTRATCADTTLAETIVQGFSPRFSAHTLDTLTGIVDKDSTLSNDWQIQSQPFKAWTNAQSGTSAVPLFKLSWSPLTGGQDWKFVLGGATASSPPTPPSGWTLVTLNGVPVIPAWVYATQVCGSVPLYSVANSGSSDHWYTTSLKEKSSFVAAGWADEGVVAYVLSPA